MCTTTYSVLASLWKVWVALKWCVSSALLDILWKVLDPIMRSQLTPKMPILYVYVAVGAHLPYKFVYVCVEFSRHFITS
jgi:hypothetical protein